MLFNNIARILIDEEKQEQFLAEDEEVLLSAHTQAFFAWLNTSSILVSQAFESDLARLLAYAIPRSDPLLEEAIAHFGWDRSGAEWDRDPAITHILTRHGGNVFLAKIMNPDHSHHTAYLELTGERQKTSFFDTRLKKKVHELLVHAQDNYPSVAAVFDYEVVGHWERELNLHQSYDQASGGDSGNDRSIFDYWWVIFIILPLLSFCGRIAQEADRVESGFGVDAPTQELIAASTDVETVLNQLFGENLSVVAIQSKNPSLYSYLESIWTNSKQKGGNLQSFGNTLGTDLSAQYEHAVRQAEPDLLREHWHIFLAKLDILGEKDAGACDNFLSGRAAFGNFPQELNDRFNKHVAKVLLAAQNFDLPQSKEAPSFNLSEVLIRQMQAETSLSKDKIIDVLQGGGGSLDRCTVFRSLIRTISEGNQNEKIDVMRNM
ncbi:hypothetical protein [Sphingorhabdus sp. Alg239-R122]|uniref:hypothetical protein n=1 Tax=Sphingorhabdus sp. Alg239-R122 TaxID=2305989 RepID=UPI0013DA48E1|nr:hypothetical protein [Sphingorhabdus sp. Alg239-R122]